MTVNREDYTEPVCPFDFSSWMKEPPVRAVPIGRIREKEDGFLAKNDYDGAERVLRYWQREAEEGRDLKGLFFIRNELMGLYRKTGREAEAMREAEEALGICEVIGPESVGAATAYVNAATVRKAFGRPAGALPLYEKARAIYERELTAGDGRLPALYNNMALCLSDLGREEPARYEEALKLFREAVKLLDTVEYGCLEQAITWLNICDTLMLRDAEYRREDGETVIRLADLEEDTEVEELVLYCPEETEEEIEVCLDEAERLLGTEGLPEDGHTAYAMEKCAPVLAYYGRFEAAAQAEKRAGRIYGGES